jgi:hypothetical protein
MHPFEHPPTNLPPGVTPHLEVRLKPGWRFDARRRALVFGKQPVLRLRGLLPAGARVTHMVPSLATSDPASLSEDEQQLARYLTVTLPPGADPAGLASALRGLDAIDEVSSPPAVALP